MAKVGDRELLEKLQNEITKRVFNRYAEIEGKESNKTELQTTIQALHETTGLPIAEIQRIATDVENELARPKTSQIPKTPDLVGVTTGLEPTLPDLGVSELTFEELSKKVENGKKEFIIHAVTFVFINAGLGVTNLMFFSGFPWSLFPLLGWGIGLVAHYLDAIVWSKRDLNKKISVIKNQIHFILSENWDQYQLTQSQEWFNAIYRMVVTEGSEMGIRTLLRNSDPTLSQESIEVMVSQIVALQEKFIIKKATFLENIQKGIKEKLEQTFT